MAANGGALRRYLEECDRSRIDLTWADLEAVVGAMPQPSIEHSAWWTGDRPQARDGGRRAMRWRLECRDCP